MDHQDMVLALSDIAAAFDDIQVELHKSSTIGVNDFNTILAFIQEGRGAQQKLVDGLITTPTGG